MGAKAYSRQQMAEAVALGSIVGAEAASKQLGMGASATRRWMARAGKAHADAITSADWAQLGEMARAQVASDFLAGRIRPKPRSSPRSPTGTPHF
jgi:hypothetical protein